MATDETKIATISKDIEYMRKSIDEIKVSVKELAGVYATQIALDDLKKEVHALRESGNLWKWLGPTLTAIIVGTVEFLLIAYLGHK